MLVDEVVGHAGRDRIGVAGCERIEVGADDLAAGGHLRDGIGASMWSNDAVADEDPDDVSPWLRDDWVPDRPPAAGAPADPVRPGDRPPPTGQRSPRPPAGPMFGEPPPEAFEEVSAPGARSTLGRKLVAAAIVLALLIGSAGALLRNGGSPDDQVPATVPATTPGEDRPSVTLEASPPPGTLPTDTSPPVTDPDATASPPTSSGLGGESTDDPSDAEALALVDGEAPSWTERTIVVPDPLATLAPTEVVALSQSNVLHIVDLPSGRLRSLDVSSVGVGLQLAVGDGAIAVFSSTRVVQIDPAEPVSSTEVLDGIIFVQPWTGTGTFIVTTPATGPQAPEQDFVLSADGSLELIDNRFVDETAFFSRTFSPGGDALATAPGGVYAIDRASVSRRISTGVLLATGTRHWAIEECDEQLRCAYSVVEWESGTVTPGVLDSIVSFGFIDPATSISPDGRSIVYRADTDGSGRRRILDVATGSSIDAGRLNQLVYPDSWASDSSGLFISGRPLQFVDRSTGATTALDDLDEIRTVATRSISS